MTIKACEHCGVEFDAESVNAKDRRRGKLKRFCSRRCRNLSRPKLPERTPEFFQRLCGVCGLIFDATPSRPQYEQPRKYCRGCVKDGRKKTLQSYHAHCKSELACKTCGKSFVIPKRLIKSGKHSGQYCSMDCVYKYRRGKYKPFNLPAEIGTRRINAQSYVEIKISTDSSVRNKYGWRLEHRYVMEQIMGRALHKWESVHHRDGNRQHNDPANLELWIKTQPTGVRLADVAEVYGAELVAARLRIRELEAQLSNRSL